MLFVATGTLQIAAPGRSLTIVVFGNHKRGPATAGDEIHLEPLGVGGHVPNAVYRVPRPRLSGFWRDRAWIFSWGVSLKIRSRPNLNAIHGFHERRVRKWKTPPFLSKKTKRRGWGTRYSSSTATIELRFRLLNCRTFLRRRRDFGVTSTYSSSVMNSMACSRFKLRKGTRRIAMSEVEERMLVSFFSRTTLTSRSLSLAFSPTIMPSYTSMVGPTKSSPRSCRL